MGHLFACALSAKTPLFTRAAEMHVLLVDPSLFTAPYDAALSEGLSLVGVQPKWVVRPIRRGERSELPARDVDDFFYRGVDEVSEHLAPVRGVLKGVSHALGLLRLIRRVRRERPEVVHFQWAVVPLLDAVAMAAIRRWAPVILTVHDTEPFNGESPSTLQRLAADLPATVCDRAVVHTCDGKSRLAQRGIRPDKLHVIPHGPLRLFGLATPERTKQRDPRWTFVLFGEIKRYKGLDVLIEAMGLVPPELRDRARVIVAGRPRLDLAPLVERMEQLGLSGVFELRPRRLSEEEMAELFAEADTFVMPYRQIDASGVYFLVKSLSTWLIASRLGIFAEDLVEGEQGALVAAEDAVQLGAALAHAIQARPRPSARTPERDAWREIGRQTRAVYASARRDWARRGGRSVAARGTR